MSFIPLEVLRLRNVCYFSPKADGKKDEISFFYERNI